MLENSNNLIDRMSAVAPLLNQQAMAHGDEFDLNILL
jgi:hypothetical protein